MKFKIVFLLILISIKINCQLNNLYRFYSKDLTEKHEKNTEVYKINVFKIKGKIYESDKKTFSHLGEGVLYENMTNDIIYKMIYKSRYLFVGHFPNTKEQQMSSIGYEIRYLRRLDVIDLEDKTKRWTYQFDKKTTLKNIKSFNPKDGDIVYCNHIKPEPELEKDSIK